MTRDSGCRAIVGSRCLLPLAGTSVYYRVPARVNETGGNRSGLTGYRSNRSGPVTVWAGIKPVQIQNSNLN